MLNRSEKTKVGIMTCLLTATLLSAETSKPAKPVLKPIDPASIDLTQPTLFLAPYSHLDDIWRWNYPQVIRDFLKSTLDDNFAAFEKYPDHVFNWSGASRYSMIKEYYPEKYEELKAWIAAGRWFPCGSSWVENDTNIPGSESIIRQILLGRTYFINEFGVSSDEYMLPDCFGFPYSLPSILNHCGIRGFSTQKLTWGSANGIPFRVGRWIGPDGKSVIAALDGGDYARVHETVYTTDAKTLERLQENKERSGLPIDFYYLGGGDKNNADRGGAPQQVSLKTLEKCLATKGPVTVIPGRADLMFNAITDEQAALFPTWEKDLLLIQHSTGVLTSMGYTKKLNRDAEILANAAERAAVSAHLFSKAVYPAGQLQKGWELVLRNHFHDTLPATSIPIAHEYAWNDGIIALNQFSGVYADSVGSLSRLLKTDLPGVPLVIYNPLSFERNDVVEALIPAELADAKAITAYNAEGQALPTQLTTGWDGKRRVLFQAKLPPVGASVYALRAEAPPKTTSDLTVTEQSLENSRYRVTLNKDGDIASIQDKLVGKELLEKPAQLEFLPDFPDLKPAWRIYYKDLTNAPRSVVANPISVRVLENGPVRIAVEIIRENEGSKIAQRICLYSGTDSERVEVANHIDWKTRGALLKAAFRFTAANSNATYNLGLGTIQRGNRHEKQYEVPSHGWIDLTDNSGTYGASILTSYKYGSDKPDDQSLRLTLIHSPDTAEWEDETLDRGRVKEMRWQDWGRHEFNYAIAGHAGDWRKSTHQEAMRFEQRPAAFAVSKTSGAKTSLSLLNINSQQVNVQAVKMAEDKSGVIIRLQELTGKPCEGIQLSSMIPVSKAEEMDGVERPLNKPLKVANNTLSLDFTPYQIRTILLKVQDPDAKPLTTPVQLTYDTDVFSYNSNREDGYGTKEAIKGRKEHLQGSSGSFDGKGGTYPAEMIGDTVTMGNVLFNIGPRTDMSYNAVACRGQTIALPEGTTVIHLLAAADVDTDVVFKAGAKEFPLTIGGWSDNIGQWDKRVFKGFVAELSYSLRNDLVRIDPGFIRDQRIGWFASHRHLPAGDTLYEYGHLFAYSLDIPEGANSLTLPQSPFVRIVAISTGDEGFAKPLQSPFQDLHRDAEFVTKFSKP